MAGLNVQSLVRYILPLYLWEREKILNERREFSILGEGIIRGQKDRMVRGQDSIRILRYYVIKAAGSFVKFFLPLLWKDTRIGNNNPYPPLPSLIREGADISHSEALRGKTIQPIENNKQNTCVNASLIPPYVLEVRGSKGVGENHPSPHPSPIGEGVSNSHHELVSGSHQILKHRGKSDVQKMLKQVQHDANSLKRTYSPILLFTHSLKKRAAFTLAEVLITLGVIGIVAAMTLPTLIQNVQNRHLEAALKKNASIIGQALHMYHAENGEPATPDIGDHMLKSSIIKYFNVLTDCGAGHGDADRACIKNYGDPDKNSNTYKNFTGTDSIDLNKFDDGQFILTDGSLILIENNNWNGPSNIYISVDVNGYKKRPNRLGQDLFMFQLDYNGALLPMGAEGTQYYDENDAYCSKTSTSQYNGAGCTYKALSDPSFWKSLP